MSPTEATLTRLQQDSTRGVLGPMIWLDNHKNDVEQLLRDGRTDDLCEATGVSKPTLLRWRRKHEVQQVNPVPTFEVSDAAYWRAKAEAYRECFDILCQKLK